VNHYEAQTSIAKRWLAGFPAPAATLIGSAVASALPNEPFTEPEPPSSWAEVTFDDASAPISQTIGRPYRITYRGTMYVRLYYPAAGAGEADVGTKMLVKLADIVDEVMCNAQFDEGVGEDGVTTKAAELRGPGSEGRWWILAVIIPYEYTRVVNT